MKQLYPAVAAADAHQGGVGPALAQWPVKEVTFDGCLG